MEKDEKDVLNKKLQSSTPHKIYLACSVCESKSVFKCRGCRRIFYCSREHQRLDWKQHKHQCKYNAMRDKDTVKTSRTLDPSSCFIDAMSLLHYEHLVNFIVTALKTHGICVIDNYIQTKIAESIRHEVSALCLTPGVMHKDYAKNAETYHSDDNTWLSGKEKLCSKLNILMRSFDCLVNSLNKRNFPSNEHKIQYKSRTQLSCYSAEGIGYKRHIDNSRTNNCLMSAIYYTNKDYNRNRDGGINRFYIRNNTKYIDVEPKFNRTVFHWSDHRAVKEVLPCGTKTYSLTTWYMTTPSISPVRSSPVLQVENKLKTPINRSHEAIENIRDISYDTQKHEAIENIQDISYHSQKQLFYAARNIEKIIGKLPRTTLQSTSPLRNKMFYSTKVNDFSSDHISRLPALIYKDHLREYENRYEKVYS